MLARMAGRGTGRLVALLNSARDQFTRATEETGLSSVSGLCYPMSVLRWYLQHILCILDLFARNLAM